jgi:hypothetical protein
MIGILCTVLELPDPTHRGARSSSHLVHCNAPRHNEIMRSIFQRDRSTVAGIRVQLYILGKSPLFLDAPYPLTSPTGLIRFTEAVAWTSIFLCSYFMIRSFHSISEDNVALFAGLLVSIFTFAEFLSAMPGRGLRIALGADIPCSLVSWGVSCVPRCLGAFLDSGWGGALWCGGERVSC